MKTVYSFLIGILLLLGCSENRPSHNPQNGKGEKETLSQKIDSLNNVLEKNGIQDSYSVSKYISACSEFRNKFKEDERAAGYFLHAGEIAAGVRKWDKAAEIYKNFFNDYKTHPKREDVLYELGQIYDFWLEDKKNAKQTMEHYLNIYPDGKYTEEVRTSLEMVDVPLLERVKMFEQKNVKK